MNTIFRTGLCAGLVALALSACSGWRGAMPAATPEDDPVVLRFATVGDSRADPLQPGQTAQDVRWAQNTRALARILREVNDRQARLLVFNGDMIMGYGDARVPAQLPATPQAYMAADVAKFYTQYAYWRGMVATVMEAGTYIVPVPGNHETQCFRKINPSCPATRHGKNATPANEQAWRDNMGDLILDVPRFTAIVGQAPSHFSTAHNPCPPGGPCTDGLTTDQTQLSYSFDVGDSHFAILNTDAVGRDGQAPLQWLGADLTQARARGARQVFVFGHRPAYTYRFQGADPHDHPGMDADPAMADAFWSLIEQHGATYFSGHQHIFNVMQPRGRAWQVLVGSGGSPFDAAPHPALATDRMYAYALVQVRRSGAVELEAIGFPDDFGPSRSLWRARLAVPFQVTSPPS